MNVIGASHLPCQFIAPLGVHGAIPRHLLLAALRPPSLQVHKSFRKSFSSANTLSPAFRRCSPPFSATIPSYSRCFQSSVDTKSKKPQFSYRLSAAYSSKNERLNLSRNLYSYNPFVRITKTATELQSGKKDKHNRPHSGQDAFFISQVGDTEFVSFGVADGVGGWTESGVDPADFAHSLCDYMASISSSWQEGDNPKPKDLLQIAYRSVMQDNSVLGGGSTACVATASPDGRVEVANLGDSGFLHLARGAVRTVSHPQTHGFNTPFQISKYPPKMLAQMTLFGGWNQLADLPKDAAESTHYVRHGDVLVFATDGVWDNLSPQDVLKIVTSWMSRLGAWTQGRDGIQASDQLERFTRLTGRERDGGGELMDNSLQALLATAITKEAKETSLDTRRDGPFAKEVRKYYPSEDWHGGKPDDICTVVAVVVEQQVMSV